MSVKRTLDLGASSLRGKAREQTRRSEDRGDLYGVVSDPVDDPKGRENDLADIGSLELRKNAARFRERGQSFN